MNSYKYIQKSKEFFIKLFSIDDTPHKIASGLALGVFLGILPGEGLLTTLVLASLFRLNRASATLGVLATNMWGTIAVLPLAALAGGKLFDQSFEKLITDFQQSYHLGLRFLISKTIFFDLTLPLIVGFFIAAGIISLGLYFLTYLLLVNKKMSVRKIKTN